MVKSAYQEKKTGKFSRNSLVEILDFHGQTLVTMPLTASIKQKLRRKISLVVVKNTEDKYILRKHDAKAEHNSGLWDISVYANVYAGESCEEAALRALNTELSIEQNNLREIASMPYQTENGIPLLAYVFSTSALSLQEKKNTYYMQGKELMFINSQDLKELVTHSPELFTAELIWAVQAGWIH